VDLVTIVTPWPFPPGKDLQTLNEQEAGWATGQYQEGFRKGINRKRPTPSLLNVPNAPSGLHRSTLKRYNFELLPIKLTASLHRVSIKSFPDCKHLLQKNYVEYKYIFFFFKM